MMLASEIRQWIKGMPDDTDIGIDDGGLCLVARPPGSTGWEDVLEVGGIPAIEDEMTPEGVDDEPLEDDSHLVEGHNSGSDADRRVVEMMANKYAEETQQERGGDKE